MRGRVYLEIVVATVVSVAAPLAFGQAPAVPCVAQDVNSPVVVDAGLSAARVYFRSSGTPNFYYVDLKAGVAGLFGVLPRPKKATSVEYQIETTDAAGGKTRGPSTTLPPTPGCAPALDAAQKNMASNLVVGQTAESDNVPAGFQCKGIVSVVTPKQELKSNSCFDPLFYYAGGAAAVAGGIIIYDHEHGNRRHRPPSPSTP